MEGEPAVFVAFPDGADRVGDEVNVVASYARDLRHSEPLIVAEEDHRSGALVGAAGEERFDLFGGEGARFCAGYLDWWETVCRVCVNVSVLDGECVERFEGVACGAGGRGGDVWSAEVGAEISHGGLGEGDAGAVLECFEERFACLDGLCGETLGELVFSECFENLGVHSLMMPAQLGFLDGCQRNVISSRSV